MTNELIEKEIDKLISLGGCNVCAPNDKEILTNSFKTIAKEVAMRFKEEIKINWTIDYMAGYNECLEDKNKLADQIINEVSK